MSIIQLVIGGTTKRSTLGQHPVELDFATLPQVSQDFIVRYGLKQYLADGMAGAESEAVAGEGVKARVAKLVSGDLSRTAGTGGGKPDTLAVITARLARDFIKGKLAAAGKTFTKEQMASAIVALVAKDDRFKKEAEKQMAAKAELAEQDDGFDLDGLIADADTTD